MANATAGDHQLTKREWSLGVRSPFCSLPPKLHEKSDSLDRNHRGSNPLRDLFVIRGHFVRSNQSETVAPMSARATVRMRGAFGPSRLRRLAR